MAIILAVSVVLPDVNTENHPIYSSFPLNEQAR